MAGAKDTGGTVWDAPNQQVVRADESPPWEEGTGGAGWRDEPAADEPNDEPTEKDKDKSASKAKAKAGS